MALQSFRAGIIHLKEIIGNYNQNYLSYAHSKRSLVMLDHLKNDENKAAVVASILV